MNKIFKKSLRNAIGIGIGIGIEHFNAIMTGGFLSKRVSTWGDSPDDNSSHKRTPQRRSFVKGVEGSGGGIIKGGGLIVVISGMKMGSWTVVPMQKPLYN